MNNNQNSKMDSITPKKLLLNSFFLTHYLSVKYGNTKESYELMLIDALLFSLPSHYYSVYKEALLSNENDECLKRQYNNKESFFKIPKLASYYHNYQKFFALPSFTNFTYGAIIQNNGDQKAELFYKRTYSNSNNNKHEKKDNDKDRNISMNHSSDGHCERDFIEENKTIFDFAFRRTIEKFGVTSIDFIANQSNAKNELVLDNYNNENIFNTKRSSIEDSLVFIVNYMNKKRLPVKAQVKGNSITTNKDSIHESNCIKYEYDNHNNNNKITKRCKFLKASQYQKTISVDKPTKAIIMNIHRGIRNKKPSSLLSNHTPKEIIRVVSPKISQSNSNMTDTNHQTPSYTNAKNSNSEFNNNLQRKQPKTSKNSFCCSNNIRTESNLSRNHQSKQSIISKFLLNHISKNTSPKQKTSFGLYKKAVIKQSQQPSNQITFLNYLNNCTSRLSNTTQNIVELLASKRSQIKNKSNSTQYNSNNKRKTTAFLNSSKGHGFKKNTTRNLEMPIFKNTLNSNCMSDNISSTIQKENYNNNNRTTAITSKEKINTHMAMNAQSNFKTTNHNSLRINKINSCDRNKTISKPKNQLSRENKNKTANLFTTLSNTHTNINTNHLCCNIGLVSKIKDLKNELKGKYCQQMTKQKHAKSNHRHYKTSSTDGIKRNINSNRKESIRHSLCTSNNNNMQSLNKEKNDLIIVNRMRGLKSMDYHSDYSSEKSYAKKNDKDKEVSTMSKSGILNGNKVVVS